MKQDILKKLEPLLKTDITTETLQEGRELIQEYYDLIETPDSSNSDETSEKDEKVEDESTSEKSAEVEIKEDKKGAESSDEIEKLIEEFNIKATAFEKANEAYFEKNLKVKKDIINRLRDLVENEKHIQKAFSEFNKIRDEWAASEDVSPKKRAAIQHDYGKLIEIFYYNINIYKELKNNDLKHNSELKKKVISDIEKLVNESSIKKVEDSIKLLQIRWDGIGPTFNEEWEQLKDKYWTNVKTVHKKIEEFYQNRKQILKENLNAKKELIEKVKELNDFEELEIKQWEKKFKEMIALQDDWKKIGFVSKKYNDEIWKEFKTITNDFFAKRKAFFDVKKGEFNKSYERKKVLIEKVEALKGSKDWKNTTRSIIQLQKDWKNVGSAGRKNEQKIWKKFRDACDHFFKAKEDFYSTIDTVYADNLKLKKALIKEIEKYKIVDDRDKNLEAIKSFSEKFNAVGKVSFEDKNDVYEAYNKAVDKIYDGMKIGKEEKENLLFESRLAGFKKNENADELIEKERSFIRKKIARLNDQIIQYDNNLGFFANSKGANALKKEVEDKIQVSKNEVEKLKEQLKLLRN